MSEPIFQTYECENPTCRLRFPTDLSVSSIEHCPSCGSLMHSIDSPYSNYQRTPSESLTGATSISILLDNLRSAQNVGSIFRTANGCGVKHVYCCGTTPTPEHHGVKKSSLGAEQFTGWSYHPNSLLMAAELKVNHNFLIAVESTPDATSLLESPDFLVNHPELTLIFGNEISGIDPQLLKQAHQVMYIPMTGNKSSLNVAVSVGIVLYLVVKLIFSQVH